MTTFILAANESKPLIDGTLLAAVIAAAAALAAAILSLIGVVHTTKATSIQRNRDSRIQQLGQLYSPLYMRRRLSLHLWKQLPGDISAQPGITNWRLIDHIEEIKAEAEGHRRLIVEKILAINVELSDLVIGSAGLLEHFPPPQSFETFLNHAATLRISWEQGKNATGSAYVPFPHDLDQDIEASIRRLRDDLARHAG